MLDIEGTDPVPETSVPASESSARPGIDVSILVVSYNTREMTLECLRSIASETVDRSYEVLVVDNDSSDGSYEAMKREFGDTPGFDIRFSAENLGFAGANNHLALDARGDYILLLNPDTVVLERAIDRLIDFAIERPDNGIWGGRTLFSDGSLNPTNCWGPFTVWSEFCAAIGLRALFPRSEFFHPRGYGTWERDTVREVGVVTGCFFLMRRRDWEHFRGLDPEFFMYGEETDLCMRAIREGMQPIVTPDATIIHHGGASETVRLDKMVRLLDGQVRLFRRHFSPAGFRLVYHAIKLGVLARIVALESLKPLRRSDSEVLWRGIWRRRAEWTRGASRVEDSIETGSVG
ncbi:glycosyltransferase family 2 protein [bacterium]|nr:glycosyltransferase family 2 protein [bacterium]